jgi:trehalose 6-phosphate phosphatase
MTPDSAEKLKEFMAAVSGAPSSVLLLDYDGSLAPFRVDRFEARPFAGVRELLKRIQSTGRTRMAVITGRPAGEIGPLLGLDPPLEVWGLHGAERIYPDGRREVEPVSAETMRHLDELRARLRRDSFGGLYEDKANGAVMHWRGIPARKARVIEERTRRLFEPLAQKDGLRMLDFEAGVELRAGRNKGGAAEAILAESEAAGGPRAPAAFIGDDYTDEAAFAAINARGAPSLSVLMRRERRETGADVWLRPPQELRELLAMWAAAVEG